MKPIKYAIATILTVVAAWLLGCEPAPAQSGTNSIPQTPQSFFTSVEGYFTSFDTNSTTFAAPADVWLGMNYRAGINSSAELGLSYDIYKPTNSSIAVGLEGVIRNASVAGTIVSEQGGVDASYVHYDLKLTAYADFGYSEFDSQPMVSLGLRVKKALTENTYAGLGIGIDKLFGTSRAVGVNTTSLLPTVTVYTGFTF